MKTTIPPAWRVNRIMHFYLFPFIFCIFLTSAPSALSQVPQGFNYQAVARDAAGNPVASATLQVRIGLLSDTTLNTIVWEEIHSPVTTSPQGIFSIVIGKGTREASSSVPQFSDIDWSSSQLFIRTAIWYQSAWREMGKAALWAVPYAMTASDISGSLKRLEVSGNAAAMDEALFEVKNKNGQTVFAVYNEGVRIYVGDGSSKAVKGGFAIGSFDESKADTLNLLVVNKDSVRVYIYDDPLNKAVKGGFGIGGFDESKGVTNDYMLVSPDSIRMYINKSSAKAVKGGFGIGGFDESKGVTSDYMIVSPDSIRMYIDNNSSKAVKGGFGIGGFDESKGVTSDYMLVGPDSIRMYIDKSPSKAVKGGFGIGGFDESKAAIQDYLKVTDDSIRLYVSNNPTKAVKGGFAIGSFDESKANANPFTVLTPDNYFIGHEAGLSNTTGLHNAFIGFKAGRSNTTGEYNVFLGEKSGYSNLSGSFNLFIGDSSGYMNTMGSRNVFLGPWAGAANTEGNYSVSIGMNAGRFNTVGYQNINIGAWSGINNVDGNRNINIGVASGNDNISGILNIKIGNWAGLTNKGSNNVMIGGYAGSYCTEGSNNVFIGYHAGRYETSSNRLYISNTNTSSPLIFGEFDNMRLIINGNSSNNMNDRTFFVNGPAGGTSDWFTDSDERKKMNIKTISDPLAKVLKLRGVEYDWIDHENHRRGKQIGFIAQEAIGVIPEVVDSSNDHYSMSYSPLTALLVEAIKEQQTHIESQKLEIILLKSEQHSLNTEVGSLKTEIEALKAIIMNGNK